MQRKYRILLLTAAVAVILGGILVYHICRQNALQYSQEYIAGTSNIKGDVDTAYFADRGEEFEIGANSYGYAVFKNPSAAFARLKTDYEDGIQLIQEEYSLQPLSQASYADYGTYGWQVTTGTAEEQEQAYFVSAFMDIYENSFHKQ